MEFHGDGSTKITDKKIKVAMDVTERRLKDLDDIIDDPIQLEELVSEAEWAVLGEDELNLN